MIRLYDKEEKLIKTFGTREMPWRPQVGDFIYDNSKPLRYRVESVSFLFFKDGSVNMHLVTQPQGLKETEYRKYTYVDGYECD